jgi:hypothetical protein
MLTLDSKFSEFIDLCRKAGACADEGEAIPVMEAANKGEGMPAEGTCADGFKLYLEGKFPEGWASWVLNTVGKEMDDKCRQFFIDKIKEPMSSLQLRTSCDFLTTAEHNLLLSKYQGKLPVAEKEIRDGVVVLKANAEVAP